jgi:hypothetical protein
MFERIEGLVCWKCGASLEHLSLPLRRLEECGACSAPLHACKLCEFFDPTVAKSCREPVAEEVKDKARANFCDYFRPRARAWAGASAGVQSDPRAQLEALFGTGTAGPTGASPEDEARARLEELFGDGAGPKSGS